MARNKSIDIAKGILITLLVLHHIVDYSFITYHISNDVLSMMQRVRDPLYLCFFMQCFFVITGYCSNFDTAAKPFLTKQIKTLLLPNVVFLAIVAAMHHDFASIPNTFIEKGGGLWFLTSLFTCKIAFYYIHRFIHNQWFVLLLLIGLSLLGTILNQSGFLPNYWWHRQSLDLLLFLYLGHWLKGRLSDRRTLYLGLSYIPIVIVLLLLNVALPHVSADFFTAPSNFIFHIILAATGSILFLRLCSCFKSNIILEYLGQNSLMVYMWQGVLLLKLIKINYDILMANNTIDSVITVVCIALSTLSFALAIGWIMDRRYIRYLWGKF